MARWWRTVLGVRPTIDALMPSQACSRHTYHTRRRCPCWPVADRNALYVMWPTRIASNTPQLIPVCVRHQRPPEWHMRFAKIRWFVDWVGGWRLYWAEDYWRLIVYRTDAKPVVKSCLMSFSFVSHTELCCRIPLVIHAAVPRPRGCSSSFVFLSDGKAYINVERRPASVHPSLCSWLELH